ncbi:MAG: tRNA (adenosine(37)-N6)-threonylcarbamoyltransferase complex dimerization subunit type 1 TsaB [Verrucomicrobia bacterium]|nr:tRNA (adenosine(37)-N6)-threonylcarbamoyltransferase complex dimerization subunit type 1 TsaB [Verrucomicrobiota bacterium]
MNRPVKSPMICLAFEFTSDRRSVAISNGCQRVLSQVVHDRGRTTPVFHLIEQALAEAQVARASIGRLAISIGPGSYTGIRLAIAAAQGWHLATGIDVVAVDTFEALLRQTQRQAVTGPRVLCVNAQRQEFAVREWDGQGWAGPLHLESADLLLQRIIVGQAVFGPDLGTWIRGLASTSSEMTARADALEAYPQASDVALLGANNDPVPPETLAPVYLREASFVKAPPHRHIPGITD